MMKHDYKDPRELALFDSMIDYKQKGMKLFVVGPICRFRSELVCRDNNVKLGKYMGQLRELDW
jgi:hypothetical protein